MHLSWAALSVNNVLTLVSRQHRVTLTVRNNPALIVDIIKFFTKSIKAPNLQNDSYFRAGLLIQPLTTEHLHHARQNGSSNLLGLDEELAPLFCALLNQNPQVDTG